jgi:cobalt/nickel transport system permease protein
MHLETPFHQGDSPLHRLSPRLKLALAAAWALAIAVSPRPWAPAAALPLGLALVLAAGLDLGAVARRMLLVNGFIAFLWLFLPFGPGPDVVATLGPLEVSRQGLSLALLVTLKSNAILLAFLALVGTSSVPALGRGLAGLGVPRKLCHLLLFTYRHLHVMAREYRRLRTAAAMRGFAPRTGLHTYRTYAYLAAMVLVRSWDRAERVHQAMRLRGFSGSFPLLEPPQTRPLDRAWAAGLLLAVAGLACLNLL